MRIKIWTPQELEEAERAKRAREEQEEREQQRINQPQRIQVNSVQEKPIPKKIRINHDEIRAESDVDRMLERLKVYGVKERKIEGDGNCQFAAMSDQMFGTPEYWDRVRQLVVEWLLEHADYPVGEDTALSDFLERDCFSTWEGYCEYMARDGSWGDHITLIAMSEIFRCTIAILSSVEINDPNNQTPLTIIRPVLSKPERLALLCHWHESHYGSLYIVD